MAYKDDLLQDEQQLPEPDVQRLTQMRLRAAGLQRKERRFSLWPATTGLAATIAVVVPLLLVVLPDRTEDAMWVEDTLLDNLEVYTDDAYFDVMLVTDSALSRSPRIQKNSRYFI